MWYGRNAQAGFENVALWHERDISHSSAERIIIPDSTTLANYLLNKTANLVETMFVYPQRMLANLHSTRGLVFSGQLLLDLVESGISREDAYRLVQGHAMRAWREDLDFHELVLSDPAITGRVPRAKIERAFDLAAPTGKHRQDFREGVSGQGCAEAGIKARRSHRPEVDETSLTGALVRTVSSSRVSSSRVSSSHVSSSNKLQQFN